MDILWLHIITAKLRIMVVYYACDICTVHYVFSTSSIASCSGLCVSNTAHTHAHTHTQHTIQLPRYVCIVAGVEFPETPDVDSVPLVCDMSSNFLTRIIDVSKVCISIQRYMRERERESECVCVCVCVCVHVLQ